VETRMQVNIHKVVLFTVHDVGFISQPISIYVMKNCYKIALAWSSAVLHLYKKVMRHNGNACPLNKVAVHWVKLVLGKRLRAGRQTISVCNQPLRW